MQREFLWCRTGLLASLLACCGVLPLVAQEEAGAPADFSERAARSPLASEPKTPAELLQAVVLMVDINRLDLAQEYLEQLVDQPLDDETLLALRDSVGTPTLLQIQQVPSLRNLIEPLIDKSDAAMLARAGDPERIAEMVRSLQGEPEDRSAALAELRALGPLAVPTLIGIIASDDSQPLADELGALLLEVGSSSIPMLQGALESSEPRVQAFAADLLGRLRSTRSIPDFWFLAFAPEIRDDVRTAAQQALLRTVGSVGGGSGVRVTSPVTSDDLVRRLNKAATDAFRRQTAFEAEPDGSVIDWTWDSDRGTVVAARVTPDQAAIREGSRHARRAVQLAPDQQRARVLDLGFALAREQASSQIFQPLSRQLNDQSLSAGPDIVSEVLREAETARRPEVAAAAADLLGQLQAPEALAGFPDRPAPVIAALDSTDPRVQFAAAQAVLRMEPRTAYRGARRVVDILKRAASSGTRPHAIIVEISADRAAQVGGLVAELGFEPLVVLSGREAFKSAAERTDVELIVLHPNIIRWPLSETLANLQADPRTSRIPLVVHGPGRLADKFQRPRRGQPQVTYATLSGTPQDLAFQIQPILDQIRATAPTSAQQKQMRTEAFASLARIAADETNRIYDLAGIEDVLAWGVAEPELAATAIETLGKIGTRTAQNMLADMIVNSPGTENDRLARKALDAHVERNGLLLSKGLAARLRGETAAAVQGGAR